MKHAKGYEPIVRYYFWLNTTTYGWTQMGAMHGYSSRRELQRDNAFNIKQSKLQGTGVLAYKVLRAEAI